ncbi:CopG family transcriptional regulator [Phormidesmis priestleyi ULC007]|uniref:CopG family transcriptional regulator n=1 Tax=Phormidesmis priestleyi ULC007 TaxID=1920490 RepID=A0A2T1DLR6_9CYAN|nr:CopG family transcriptional regulator [Phormidesmis priestleyi ULC007]PSB21433.1 CopG family transcriptional regulator [Phormidesmis priestleyi ULC007]PZO48582.1 MAG: CopG family transcriptional regulator [Phormidesmis priestleyi]PZO51008.1 MAG: CopG family transcriptional regulator [Phormidesmis priestleyi]
MSKPEIFVTFRVTQEEKDLLKQYCEQSARNQTDVLRELIRSLKRRLK